MAGVAEGPEAKAVLIENLRWAVQFAPKQKLTIEPINTHDLPGYFLNDFDLAIEVLEAVNAPNLSLQFDAYHAQRITGDMMATWDKVRSRVGHIQVAGVPGRHEPICEDIDYPAFFALLDKQKYKGWVSGEYIPAGKTEDGLSWIG
ncbi:UNVERIFIED_CONTAM: hypothetical protein GTU68_033074 [Idotea baltica]|nr:hypothetical protein [Idotea baltica]